MARSIIQTEKECWFCRSPYVETHHAIHGVSNRKNADKYGLTIYVCPYHHAGIHNDRKIDLQVIQMAQRKFEETHTREEFMAIFGKNWLD